MLSSRYFRQDDADLGNGVSVEVPFRAVERDSGREFRHCHLRGFRKGRVDHIPASVERGDNFEVSRRVRFKRHFRRSSARRLEGGDDPGKYLSRSGGSGNALHIGTVLVSAPNGDEVMISVPYGVVVAEIAGSSRFYEDEVFGKVQSGERSEFAEFKGPIREDAFDFKSRSRVRRFVATGNFSGDDGKIAEISGIGKYRVGPQEFVERDFTHAERERESVMVGVFREGGDSERPEEREEFGDAHLLGHLDGRNVETSGKGFGDGYRSTVGEGIVFGFVGRSFGGFERDGKVENGILGRYAFVLHGEQIRKRLGRGSDLPRSENGVHLSTFFRSVVRSTHEREDFFGFPIHHQNPVIRNAPPSDFTQGTVRDLLDLVGEVEVERRAEKGRIFGGSDGISDILVGRIRRDRSDFNSVRSQVRRIVPTA